MTLVTAFTLVSGAFIGLVAGVAMYYAREFMWNFAPIFGMLAGMGIWYMLATTLGMESTGPIVITLIAHMLAGGLVGMELTSRHIGTSLMSEF